jgi:hypothetical protein
MQSNRIILLFLGVLFGIFLFTNCKGDTNENGDEGVENSNTTDTITTSLEINPYVAGVGLDVEMLKDQIDLNMDISGLTLQDLRLLRNAFAAQQGYCFMAADLRGFYGASSWYNERMDERYWKEESGELIEEITYTTEQEAFIAKIKNRENELLAQNYYSTNGVTLANVNNVVNLFQLLQPDLDLMEMLAKQGFAIVPNKHIQLFHVYEENDYQQFPNFVTTDMYMQLFHMYFGFILRQLEEDKLIDLAIQLCQGFHKECTHIIATEKHPDIIKAAKYAQTYYAVGYSIFTNKTLPVDKEYEADYKKEIEKVNKAEDDFSVYLGYTDVTFPYSLYKPRGHYTRTKTLEKYFKGMMWLQNVPQCATEDASLRIAALSSYILHNGAVLKGDLLNTYTSLLEPITFLIGEPDNMSYMNVAAIIKSKGYKDLSFLTDSKKWGEFKKAVLTEEKKYNTIKPKIEVSCPEKINFMPQRYLADNEILQELVDVTSSETKRGFPKGLDVMAAFGGKAAEDILLNELNENENWSEYTVRLGKLKERFKKLNWDASVYNKWIDGLMASLKTDAKYPYFMQTPQWQKKNLNAALASWAELKHDAILYAEQPMAAECGGGGPPDPITVGYVEPNVAYWKKVIELLNLTEKVLQNHGLMNNRITSVHAGMLDNAKFLLSASEKELSGKKLSDQEYQQIEYIGSTFEWLTIDLIDQGYLDGWHNVQGPDRWVAVVADIYTGNAPNNPEKGILHVGTGYVNNIFVVVEIEGYLYLTKGAVFSYHEFTRPINERLTDEEWQKMLEKKQAPDVPSWMKEIMLPSKEIKSNEKIFYSSGC